MTSIDQYLNNPHWAAIYDYAMGPPNGGYYKSWVQGSPGMMEPLPLWSNEYSHTYMKHGQNNVNPYRGNIKNFAPSVTPRLKQQVEVCGHDTINPGGCQDAAIRKVFSVDASHRFQKHEHPGHYRHSPRNTPHPYGVSYKTGYQPGEFWIPPNGRSG